jgi:catechol 2,3-dioxygenase-like lactoylglutathione lyase family enzyme
MEIQELMPMLCVRDLAASEDFYRRVGFAVEFSEPHIALLRNGVRGLYLVTESSPTVDKPGVSLFPLADPSRVAAVIVLRVADCRQTHEELVSRGVRFLTPPHEPPWGGWRCFAPDPDGYLLEFEEAPQP